MLGIMRTIRLLLLVWSLALPLAAASMHGHAPADQETRQELDAITPANEGADEGYRLSLVVMGPLEPLYAWFGHAALLLERPDGRSVMYDWGVFDTSKPGFALDFARGRMRYAIWRSDGEKRLASELESGRSITCYPLSIHGTTLRDTIDFLDWQTSPEHAAYLYHFYEDNCATRIRDVIDSATGGAFRRWTEAQSFSGTYRSLAGEGLARNPLVRWFLEFLEGPSVDRPIGMWQAMFLPETLGEATASFFGTTPVVLQEGTPFRHAGPPAWTVPLAIGLALAAGYVLLGRHGRMFGSFLLCFLGVISLLPWYCMLATDLDMAWWNTCAAYINPLLLPASRRLAQGRERSAAMILRVLSAIALVCLIVPWRNDAGTVALVLPLYLVMAFPTRKS